MHYLALRYWHEDPRTADPDTPEFAEDVARYAEFDKAAGAAVSCSRRRATGWCRPPESTADPMP